MLKSERRRIPAAARAEKAMSSPLRILLLFCGCCVVLRAKIFRCSLFLFGFVLAADFCTFAFLLFMILLSSARG
jgi:hypothetical protein